MNQNKFFYCRHCGNLVEMIHSAGVPMVCCGEKMDPLPLNDPKASAEKHLPVASLKDGILHVKIGMVPHPMETEHYIRWVYVQTKTRSFRRDLLPGQPPETEVWVGDDRPLAVYAYCNIHGLWMTAL